jgi:hypothetical protein
MPSPAIGGRNTTGLKPEGPDAETEYPLLQTLANGQDVPDRGTVYVQLIGTGSVATVTLNQRWQVNLNSGTALSNNALYEFMFHVDKDDNVLVQNATVRRIFFRRGI